MVPSGARDRRCGGRSGPSVQDRGTRADDVAGRCGAPAGSSYRCPMDHCDACGFRYDEIDPTAAPDRLRAGAATIATLLGAPAAVLGRRPDTGTWSALEYGCHVRDVLLVQRERVLLARREDHPHVVPMGRDERAE